VIKLRIEGLEGRWVILGIKALPLMNKFWCYEILAAAMPDSAGRRGSLPPFLLFIPLPPLLLLPFFTKMEEGL
jgi:hypothetical protein